MAALIDATTKYTRQAQGGVTTHGVAPAISSAQTTGAFPRGGLESRDSRDELMQQKAEFMQKSGSSMTPFGEVVATDEDFKWMQKKRETAEFANLDAWIGQNFHTPSVSQRKWLQETFPEYYEARERLMIDRAKFALRVKLLKLRGPKNHKDLILQWGLSTGRIELDKGWDIVGMYAEAGGRDIEEEAGRFKNGLMNYRRYLSDWERDKNAKVGNNPFKPKGAGPADGQTPSPFPNNSKVEGDNRYPAFLSGVIGRAYGEA